MCKAYLKVQSISTAISQQDDLENGCLNLLKQCGFTLQKWMREKKKNY